MNHPIGSGHPDKVDSVAKKIAEPEKPNDHSFSVRLARGSVEVPAWRGWIHAGMLPLVIVSGIVLVTFSHTVEAKMSSTVFAFTSLLLFGVSAMYHRFTWKSEQKIFLKRLDHANIFLLIAGTYTPVAVLALPKHKGFVLLAIVWSGALLGICFRIFWITAPRWLYVPLYLALGWAALAYLGDFARVSVPVVVLIISGGILYTFGAICYALKKPNPFPGIFGFHEIFHTCTAFAFFCHWTAALILVLR